MKRLRPASRTSGFSLLEMMLSTAVLVGLVIGVFEVIDALARKELARTNASYMREVSRAMKEELKDVRVFDAYFAAAGNGTVPLEIALEESAACPNLLKACTVAGQLLPAAGLDAKFKNISLNRNGISLVLVPVQDARAGMNNGYYQGALHAFEILIAENGPTERDMANMTRMVLGAGGGVLRNYTAATLVGANVEGPDGPARPLMRAIGTGDATSGRPGLAATNWYNQIKARVPADDEAVIVSYEFVTRSDAAGDYMYRTAQANAALNTMYAPLSMGNNNIVGADYTNVAGDMTAKQGAHLKGGTQALKNVTITEVKDQTGAVIADSGTLSVAQNKPGTTDPLPARRAAVLGAVDMTTGKPVSAVGDVNAVKAKVTNRLEAETANFTSKTEQIAVNNMVVNGDVTAGGLSGSFGSANAPTMNVSNVARFAVTGAGGLATQTLTNAIVDAGNQPVVLGGATAAGIDTLKTGTLGAGQLKLGTSTTLQQFGSCAQGCN